MVACWSRRSDDNKGDSSVAAAAEDRGNLRLE